MKHAFITGANRGLGKGFVDYLIERGYFVYAGVRNIPKNHKSSNLKFIKIDVSHDNSVDNAVKTIASSTKLLNLLVNNAGVNKDSATNSHREYVCNLNDLKRDSLIKMFDVNSVSPIIITQKLLHLLKPNPSFVINISSCRASFHDEFENSTGNYGYRASKTALNMLTFCSTWDLPENVKTFSVHPGSVKTDMNPGGTDSPISQAERIISITEDWKEQFNGKFLRYDGEFYPL